MKKTLATLLLATTFLAPAYAAHPQCGETELSGIMGDMKDAMKAYKKALKENDTSKQLEITGNLLTLIDQGSELIPLQISDNLSLTEEQKGLVEKYKKGMKKLKDAVVQLSEANNPMAKKAALKLVGSASKQGHKAFKMDCDA
ncbi:hypothetical protein [Thalassotalea fusca]